MAKEYEKISVNISKELYQCIKNDVKNSYDIEMTVSHKIREILRKHYAKKLKKDNKNIVEKT